MRARYAGLAGTRRTALAACAVLALAPWASAQEIGSLVSPGPLARAHAKLEGIANCQKCHEPGRKVTAAKCLECHKPIAESIAAKKGVHRNVTNDCVSCHVEHAGADAELRPLDTKRFNHLKETGYPLDGKHALIATDCAKCHKTRSYLGLKAECASCHNDVHNGALGANCASCHATTVAFKDSAKAFDHSKTAFPLTEAHVTVECAKCHVNKVYKGIKFALCTDCHKDPHMTAFGTGCVSCHAGPTWRTEKVDHSKTRYALVGKHQSTPCVSCHKLPPMKAKLEFDRCAVCHADPHKGEFKQDCAACHTPERFRNAPFDHTANTTFPLTGRHATTPCGSCHKNVSTTAGVERSLVLADFRGLSKACASCHTDVHLAKLGSACESCHGTETFRLATFKHPKDADFYGGQHAQVACGKCHGGEGVQKAGLTGKPVGQRVYRGLSQACASCHKDVHLGQLGANCESCHAVDAAKFAAPKFSHAATAFALAGKHQTTECAKCHARETAAFPAGTGTAVHFKGVASACASCHKDVHLGQFGANCQSCHGSETFKLATYTHRQHPQFFTAKHATTRCQDCHKSVEADFPAGRGTAVRYASLSTACATCHEDVHRGTLGDRCETCHSTQQWPGASRAFHKATVFPLDGQHLRVACAQCHIDGQTKGTPTRCYDCHWIRHQDDLFRTQLGNECENCHRTTSWTSVVWDHQAATGFALAGAHTVLPCQSCHANNQFFGTSTDCYACHQRDFVAANSPPHLSGGFSTNCRLCHRFSDTTWQQAKFDHSQTAFPLLGVHATQPCTACHQNNVFQGTPTACVGCHQTNYSNSKNPNHAAAGFSTACDTCHNVADASWSQGVFNHAATAFPLLGVHATQACSACHSDNVFKGKPIACISCHQTDYNNTNNPNHAAAGFATTCDTCHKVSDASWNQATFAHTAFPLAGVHATTACTSCHINGNYAASLPTNCAGCHSKDYQGATTPVNHVGMPTTCDSCHSFSDASWTLASTFNHAAYFTLVGTHATTACANCHVNGNYTTVPTTPCAACHTKDYQGATTPVNHAGMPTTCDSCHANTDASWTLASTFNHATYFQLAGAHTTAACSACHLNGNYTTVPTSPCYACHATDYTNAVSPVNHVASNFPTTCDTCHKFSDTSWTQATFSHTVFPLVGVHATTACANCHINNNYSTVPTTCAGCHASTMTTATTPVNHTGFPTTCDSCHSNTDASWTLASVFNHSTYFALAGAHTTAACSSCHVNGNYTTVPTNPCYACHATDYTNATTPVPHSGFPTTCDTCHKFSDTSWTQATFNHASVFQLVGVHATTACANCHINNNYTTVPTTCAGCHASTMATATTPVNHAGFPTTCDSCHSNADASWTLASVFNHNTYFALAGAHTTAACTSCHKAGNFTTVPASPCYACHATDFQSATTPVNHSGFPTTCDTCHKFSDTSWTQAVFNHASVFPLVGVHATTACANCHINNNYTTVPTGPCSACHLSAYQSATTPVNHAGLPTTCDSCHGNADSSWTVASAFNHNTYFALAGAHVTAACTSCHKAGNFTTVPTSPCYACHATDYQNAVSPVNHIAAGFPTTCDTCHKFSDTSWTQAVFNHTWFPMNHGNSGGVCSACHTNPSNYAIFSCTTGCHPQSQTNSNHQGVSGYVYNSSACYSCHPNGGGGG